ncbi:MAG: hypothetical protein QXT74_04755 [Candidatus Nezhaarchaeales archaeon]
MGFISPLALLSIPPLTYLVIRAVALRAVGKALCKKMSAEKYSPLIISELRLAYCVTKSLEKALLFVAEGDYPEVSTSLRKILKRAEGGADLSREVLKYAENRAPPGLGQFLVRFVARPEDCAPPQGLNRKLREAYVEDVKRLRLNVLLFFGLAFLLPIPVALLLLLLGRVDCLLISTPIHIIALAAAAKMLAIRTSGPMGG